MAQKIQVLLLDDLDGGDASETVAFGLDGTSYEIDLSAKNAAKLRDALAGYVGAARKAGQAVGRPAGRPRSGRGGRAAMDREQAAAIRSWAKGKGLKVSDRGRIPASIVEQYNASV
ncbi:MAG TPA: Lsr2 family protein [Mycobacteriales bacterium]|nr:Lsr2 family protein [Mycobacteriales bacterium]